MTNTTKTAPKAKAPRDWQCRECGKRTTADRAFGAMFGMTAGCSKCGSRDMSRAEAGEWAWSVSFETATIQKGVAPTRDVAESLAVAAHDRLVVKGFNPDKLAWHVDAVSL